MHIRLSSDHLTADWSCIDVFDLFVDIIFAFISRFVGDLSTELNEGSIRLITNIPRIQIFERI